MTRMKPLRVTQSRNRSLHGCETAIGAAAVDAVRPSAHIRLIGTLTMRVPDRNLAALATACESDAFVATQRQDS